MSIQAVGWALGRPIEDAAAKLILVVLANYADHNTGRCYPTIETIAREASQSERSVQRKLRVLADDGYIEIAPSEEKTGRQRANSYWLVLRPHEKRGANAAGEGDNLTPLAAECADTAEIADNALDDMGNSAQTDSAGEGVNLSPRGDTAVTGEGDTAVTPYKNRQIEPSDSPQNPPPGVFEGKGHSGKIRNPDIEGFAKFERLYPFDGLMSRDKAVEVWANMTVRDREAAIRYAPRFAEEVRRRPNKLKDAHRWLSKRDWENLAQHEKREAAKMGLKNPMVFVREGSRAWDTWVRYLASIGQAMGPAYFSKWARCSGRSMPSLFPPGYEGSEQAESEHGDDGDRSARYAQGGSHDRQH